MKVAVISFTVQGGSMNERLVRRLGQLSIECSGYAKTRYIDQVLPLGLVPVETSLHEWTKEHFSKEDGIIFVGAAGIAVRAIAPFLKDKYTDPAVVVADEQGKFAISLLSGHVGGANDLALQVASALNATPVITTATDVNGAFAIDVFAKENGLQIPDRELAKEISADILQGVPVGMFSDIYLEGGLPQGFTQKEMCERNVWITWMEKLSPDSLCMAFCGQDASILRLVPRVLCIGVGCRKGTEAGAVLKAIRQAMKENNCLEEAIAAIASIDLKKEEPGIIEAAREMGVPFHTYTAEQLSTAPGEYPESAFVETVTGIGNVCQRAAMIEAGENGILISGKKVYDGVTVAISRSLKKISSVCGRAQRAAGSGACGGK